MQKDLRIVTLTSYNFYITGDTGYFSIRRYNNDSHVSFKIQPQYIITNSLISISPNPAQNILHITGLQLNTKLSIVNELGKTVAQTNTYNNIYDWNVQKLSAGNYFLVASQNNKPVASIKFIKQ